ncbi:hypothetical protein LEMLEM_LOCUS14160, partial [Lemmus lemmus]
KSSSAQPLSKLNHLDNHAVDETGLGGACSEVPSMYIQPFRISSRSSLQCVQFHSRNRLYYFICRVAIPEGALTPGCSAPLSRTDDSSHRAKS